MYVEKGWIYTEMLTDFFWIRFIADFIFLFLIPCISDFSTFFIVV